MQQEKQQTTTGASTGPTTSNIAETTTSSGAGITTTTPQGPVDICPPPCVEREGKLGDGICDKELNTEECNYDGGRDADDPDIVNI